MTTITQQPLTNDVPVSKPNFKGRKKQPELTSIEHYPNYQVRRYEVAASNDKKRGVGLASLMCPGLGQAINGSWGKGIAFFAAANILPVIVMGTSATAGLLAGKRGNRSGAKMGMFGVFAAFASAIGFRIWSIFDATKCAKSEAVQIVPNNNVKTNIDKQI